MQLRHVINLHKGFTALVIGALMLAYGNGSLGAWVYLALHGTYGMLWLLKERIFPDRQWQQPIGWFPAVVMFLVLALYWLAPFLLISSRAVPPMPLVALAIVLNLLGVFLCPQPQHQLPGRAAHLSLLRAAGDALAALRGACRFWFRSLSAQHAQEG
jgi:hypothetical protein